MLGRCGTVATITASSTARCGCWISARSSPSSACGYYLLAGNASARTAGIVFGSAALVLLFVFSTLEVNTFLYHYVPGLRAGGVSILWSVFALALISAGIWKDVRAIRYAGLALFAVVAWKGPLCRPRPARPDLSHHRLHCFGILVLSGSFVYLKCRPVLAAKRKELGP